MGHIYLYTGDGAGKTCNALGLALRSLGHNHKVVIIQFLKWWDKTGEWKFRHSNYRIIQFGRKGWHGLRNLTQEDKELAHKGLTVAKMILDSPHPPNLLVLDELNLAIHCRLLNNKEVLSVLNNIPNKTNVIITGRNASKPLLKRADFVNVISCTKMPREDICVEGIQY